MKLATSTSFSVTTLAVQIAETGANRPMMSPGIEKRQDLPPAVGQRLVRRGPAVEDDVPEGVWQPLGDDISAPGAHFVGTVHQVTQRSVVQRAEIDEQRQLVVEGLSPRFHNPTVIHLVHPCGSKYIGLT
ncbi:MAG: hypothetical protein U5L06_01055 [Rhodovibrio sp.]|nr:hypothetical protein [Rhodovibrio sp.]